MWSDNHRTHYCPDSEFALVSENDFEFEQCQCFTSQLATAAASSPREAVATTPLAAEQTWYRTLAALAKVIGSATAPVAQPGVPQQTAAQQQLEMREEAAAFVKVPKR